MKIKLKETPEQKELIRAMGSKDATVSGPAQQAFAAFLGPVVQKVLSQVGTASMIYKDLPFDEDTDASFPLDLYYQQGVDTIKVWSQSMAGGLGSSHVYGMQELKFLTYPLDSAVEVNKKYARKARLDVVAAAIQRMTQEVLVKQERNAWIVLMKALGEATTAGLGHVINATQTNVFQLDDLNRMLTRAKRIGQSFAAGTSDDAGTSITDILVSPEIKQEIRSFAYQPMNTRGVPNSDESTAVALPESIREGIFRAAGAQEIYGVAITELQELGNGQKYNSLFANFYTGAFTAATDEVVIALDLTKEGFLRPISRTPDTGTEFTTQVDDQWVKRADKMGWFGGLEEGRAVIDSRAIMGIVV